MNGAALRSAVEAALAVEMLRDLRDAGVITTIDDLMIRGGVMPDNVLRLHALARAEGKAVRGVGELVGAESVPALEGTRELLRRQGVEDQDFDAALRQLLRTGAN